MVDERVFEVAFLGEQCSDVGVDAARNVTCQALRGEGSVQNHHVASDVREHGGGFDTEARRSSPAGRTDECGSSIHVSK